MKSKVRGDRELIAALRELSRGVTVSDMDAAAVNAMEPMRDDTADRFRKNRNYAGKWPGFPDPPPTRKGGHLDEGFVVRRTKGNSRRREYRLGAIKRARYLAHLLEFGTAPHWQPNFKGGFMHPGARAYPAMTPAYESHKAEVVNRMGRAIWSIIQTKAFTVGRTRTRRR